MTQNNKKDLIDFAEKQRTFMKDRTQSQMAYGLGSTFLAGLILLMHYLGLSPISNQILIYVLCAVVGVGIIGSLIPFIVKRINEK